MAVKGVLLDFNGTLFFDSEYHFKSFCGFYQRYGLPTPSKEYIISNVFGRTNKELFLQEFNANATAEDIEEFSALKEQAYTDFCRAYPDKLKLVDGAADMLNYLKANSIPYCIATGSPYCNVKFYFDALGIGRWFTFDNVVYCDGSFPGKPAPDIYRIAAHKLGLEPDECVVFEDGTSGIISANAAGIAKVIAVWEEGFPSPVNKSTHVDGMYHNFTDWKNMLSTVGII